MNRNLVLSISMWVVIGLGPTGCSAQPFLVASPTPTPTFTPTPQPTPTPTFTPTPSPTPTATVTPTPSQTGVQAIKQTDGSTLVVDYDDGFQFVLGGGWLVATRVAGPNPWAQIDTTFLNEAGLDAGALANIENMVDLSTMQVFAIPRDRKYDPVGLLASISVDVHDDASLVSLPINTLVAQNEQSMKQQYDTKILKSSRAASPNPNGVEFGTLDALVTPSGNMQDRLALVFFKPHGKVSEITLIAGAQFGDELSPAIDTIISTLKLLEAAPGGPEIADPVSAQAALQASVPDLRSKAKEKYPGFATKPGKLTYTVSLFSFDQVLWLTGWCATTSSILASNLSSIQFRFNLDGKDVPLTDFAVDDSPNGGQQCHDYYTALSSWPVGSHHLTSTMTITSKINDGISDYLPGDAFVDDYTVNVKP